jgi:cellulose synthase/poly-beta-1,6-N-acetylglucosamine synthase-like glycosyltransferase
LQVVMQGRRVVYDEAAIAYDRLPERAKDEFLRKVRTLSGNFQLAVVLPQALVPWRNPIWAQFISHKLLRLAIPWMLLAVFLASTLLLDGSLYFIAFLAQVLFYALAVLALAGGPGLRWRVATAAASFVVLNAAAWVAFWMWICGRTEGAWKKVTYDFSLPRD